MKHCYCALAVVALGLSSQAQADSILGVYAGADVWQAKTNGRFANHEPMQPFNFKDSSQHAYHIAIEHLVPVLPNIRLQYTSLQSKGQALLNNELIYADKRFDSGSQLTTSLTLRITDYILYYELFDNPLLSLDLGVSAKHLKGDFALATTDNTAVQTLDHWLPMLYVDSSVSLLTTGFAVFVAGNVSAVQDGRLYDTQAGVTYQLVDTLLADVQFKVAYRVMDLRLKGLDKLHTDLTFKGIYAGIAFHF